MRDYGPLTSTILPIKIREDSEVLIRGLPFDLTRAEADKVAGVVMALAEKPDSFTVATEASK